MARKYSMWQNCQIKIEDNENEEYIVELGTYLPIKKRIEDLRAAGMNLMAYRQAYAEFENGTQDLDIDDYDNELLGADELDFLELKKRHFEILKRQAEAQQEYQKELIRAEEEAKFQERYKEERAKENTIQNNEKKSE